MTGTYHRLNGRGIVVRCALAVVVSCGMARTSSGDTYTWDANGNSPPDGAFSDPLNWNPDGLPGSYDSIQVNSSSTVIIDLYASVGSCWTNYGSVTLQGAGDELVVKNSLGCYAGQITIQDLRVSADSLEFMGLHLPQVDVANKPGDFWRDPPRYRGDRYRVAEHPRHTRWRHGQCR